MIYLLLGLDLKNKNIYTNKLIQESESIFLSPNILTKELIMNHSMSTSLFGDKPIIIIEDILKDENIIFNKDELQILKESETIFIFKEDKLLVEEQKKYKKYVTIENFELKKKTQNNKFNVFSITDAYAVKNKIVTWTLYRKAIESGIEPEAIAGVLFWKNKIMILNGSKVFSKDELKKNSSNIISLYHKAHGGDRDFVVGLEQFILSSC